MYLIVFIILVFVVAVLLILCCDAFCCLEPGVYDDGAGGGSGPE